MLDRLAQETARRARDVADRLGISEAAPLEATGRGEIGSSAPRLRNEPATILRRVPELGTVFALTGTKPWFTRSSAVRRARK